MTRLFNTDGSSLLAALTNRQSNVRQLPLSKRMLLKEGWSGQLSPRSWKWRFWYLMKRFPHLSQRLWAPYKFSEDKNHLLRHLLHEGSSITLKVRITLHYGQMNSHATEDTSTKRTMVEGFQLWTLLPSCVMSCVSCAQAWKVQLVTC